MAGSLIELRNPFACLHLGEQAQFATHDLDTPLPMDRRPLVFVHGMEYKDTNEVIRDFVRPFEKAAGLFLANKEESFRVYLIHWTSTLGCPRGSDFSSRLRRRFGLGALVLFGLGRWSWFLTDLEKRAVQCAARLSKVFVPLTQSNTNKPMIVSHSMGALIWAEIVQHIVSLANGKNPDLGVWLSLQPALPNNVFAPNGRYVNVMRGYKRHRLRVWYSRFDLVLSSLYLGAKGCFALGLVGSTHLRKYQQRDVTWVCREAHGVANIFSWHGGFFDRVKGILSEEVKRLVALTEKAKIGVMP